MGQVTTVVATRDRWAELAWSLARHEPPVILVDNGSSDGTPARVRDAFPEVQVIELGTNRGAVARNAGVEAAATPYVAFADDDSWWAPGALDRAVELLDRYPRLAVVAARILVGPQERLDPVAATMAASPLSSEGLPGPAVLGFVACGAVVRRSAFLEVGGFDPVVVWPGEEERVALDLATRGWQLVYADDVVAHHHPSSMRSPSDARRAIERRNALLTAVMRRPWRVVAGRYAAAWRAGGPSRAGALHTVPRLPRALARRRPLPPSVERRRALLDLQES
jgi:GT2 family glycosyltransferase